MTPFMNRRTACLALAGLALVACSPSKPQFRSIDITGADYARDFKLADPQGQLRSIADFKGRAVVVFFGFTQCPDVCPTAMSDLAQVKQKLGPEGERLQGLFITLDPERDSPEVLQAYMANFDPSFVALRPTPEQLAEVTQHFKIFYKKNEGRTPGSYTLDHSAGSYVFDPQGRVRLFTRPNIGVEGLTEDVKLLLAGK